MEQEIGRREFIRRGTIAGAIAASGLPVAEALAAPLTGTQPPMSDGEMAESFVELADRQLDSQTFCLSVYDSITPTLAFSAPDAASAREWQRAARRRVIDRLGGFPATRVALDPAVLETKDFGSYTRERIVFQTRENLSAIGYLLLPKDRPRPLPVVIALSGHGRGVDDILGIASDGTQSPQRGVGYAKEYGIQCVEHGYATFAVEQFAFGAALRSTAAAWPRLAHPAAERRRCLPLRSTIV